jgi:hypothetical protein
MAVPSVAGQHDVVGTKDSADPGGDRLLPDAWMDATGDTACLDKLDRALFEPADQPHGTVQVLRRRARLIRYHCQPFRRGSEPTSLPS